MGDRPAVLTAMEAQGLFRLLEGLGAAAYVRGYGSVCVECGQNVANDGHKKDCLIAWWLGRLGAWKP